MPMKVIHNLDPIYNEDSKILILGSMPSRISSQLHFYYANKQNRFWKIMEILFKQHFHSNEDKKKFLLANHIALWDVFASCEIDGSKDSSIKNSKLNPIDLLLRKSNIQCIFCTGKTAYETLLKNSNFSIPILYLPSPSSANAQFSLEDLVQEYEIIKNYLKN